MSGPGVAPTLVLQVWLVDGQLASSAVIDATALGKEAVVHLLCEAVDLYAEDLS